MCSFMNHCRAIWLGLWILLSGSAMAQICVLQPQEFRQVRPSLWVRPAQPQDRTGWTEPTVVWVGRDRLWVADPGPHLCSGRALRAWLLATFPGKVHALLNTHAHPENVLANSAWPVGTPIWASAETGLQMRRRCPDCLQGMRQRWGEELLRGTRIVIPNRRLAQAQTLQLGDAPWVVQLVTQVHTESDLQLRSLHEPLAMVGGLVSWTQVPELARSDVGRWQDHLEAMLRSPPRELLGSAGLEDSIRKIENTRNYIQTQRQAVRRAVEQGRQIHELSSSADGPGIVQDAWTAADQERHQRNLQRLWRIEEERWLMDQPER